ncbi:hypothetical protein GJAV_G00138950 [Gymnothorax javanicus]|nr:hypothetical protein GJAV_G00138950 [Gymnothorax javanicus]
MEDSCRAQGDVRANWTLRLYKNRTRIHNYSRLRRHVLKVEFAWHTKSKPDLQFRITDNKLRPEKLQTTGRTRRRHRQEQWR